MENAGRGCVEILVTLNCRHAVIACGPGNNGGDGFVIARHLSIAGIPSKVILFAEPESYRGDAAINLRIIERMPIPITVFDNGIADDEAATLFNRVGRDDADWLVDAMLGTGATPPLRSPYDRVIPLMNSLTLNRMAIDIPTGLDADEGTVDPSVFEADVTCTFIANKPGFRSEKAKSCLGHVSVIGIGAPDRPDA